MTETHKPLEGAIFPIGEKNEAYQHVFTGQSYLEALVQAPDGHFGISHVSFEPGCRNNWHAHVAGCQILLVTGGEGFYQEEGAPARRLHPGDVVVIEEGVKHWHGATDKSWFSHIAITSGDAQWFEPVDDETYSSCHH